MITFITRYEFRYFFSTSAGYVLVGLFLLVNGFFTWMYGQDVFFRGEASLGAFFDGAYWSLFFFIPAWGMNTLAREWRSGHWRLFRVRGIAVAEWILGKWLAQWFILGMSLLLLALYGASLEWLSPRTEGFWWIGYLGLWAYGGGLSALTLLAGAWVRSAGVTYLLALLTGGVFHTLTGLLAPAFPPAWQPWVQQLHAGHHLHTLWSGLVDWSQPAFLISIPVAALWMAIRRLQEPGRPASNTKNA